MAEGDAALREEMEKVRERTRLQALAQGLPPKDAEARAAAAVEQFCAKWGIRLDPPPVPVRPVPPPAMARPLPGRTVDLGSSPLRSPSESVDRTQPIRIADLLKKVRENAPGGAAAMAAARPTLHSLLERVRSKNLPASTPTMEIPPVAPLAAPPAPGPSTQPATGPLPPFPGVGSRTQPVHIRNAPVHEQVAPLPGGETVVAAAASLAERRRQLLDEFDRTYVEVQSMIEARIAESQGLEPSSSGPPAEYTTRDIQLIARDLDRLRGGLRSMLSLCEELLNQLGALVPPGSVPPSGEAR